jgi:nitrite reductase (NADH) small subunit
MAEFRRVCALDDLPEGAGRVFLVNGREVALFRVEGVVHALDNVCCHAGGPLGEGRVEGPIVVCPWHSWRFDVRTGRSLLSDLLYVERFETRVRDGQVEVRV